MSKVPLGPHVRSAIPLSQTVATGNGRGADGGGGHHARHVRPLLLLQPRRVPHAGPPHGVRLRGLPQGAHPGI
ncbi:Os02g0611000 [Oryza sativa Japonica Group]|uniref:Uncharacterized protein n=2 Tax=Oryza sativa subsp. japonica TaxID=39947 RepID=A0A0N7KFN5_ORYSJ|nr:hypothetical protein EE612_012345 [Oryza sativa]BAD19230.1 unknown protein [Oryza sativa Japonica Group]BAD19675.1 unknown protein [Oryza sativa Japonica Group]BAS79713.1 Os02g0611000 [Oryza sativa Japonica Group]